MCVCVYIPRSRGGRSKAAASKDDSGEEDEEEEEQEEEPTPKVQTGWMNHKSF